MGQEEEERVEHVAWRYACSMMQDPMGRVGS